MYSLNFKCALGLALIALATAAVMAPTRAARDLSITPQTQSEYELVVLEVDDCVYCQLFRRDVVPTYQTTTHAKSIPMRFIDLEHGVLDAFKLSAPIETVPTVILLHRHREVGRLAGHIGPEIFLHAVKRLLSEAP